MTFTNLPNNHAAISGLPEDAELISIYQHDNEHLLTYWHNDKKDWAEITLQPGSWQYIGTVGEITEEQAKEIFDPGEYASARKMLAAYFRAISLSGKVVIIKKL